MSTDDIKYLRHWDSPFSHRKSPNTQSIDMQASKEMDANQDLLAKTQANVDIKQDLGQDIVNATIDSSNAVQDAFQAVPAVGTPERKAYYDLKNWKYDNTIPQDTLETDPLTSEIFTSNQVMNEAVRENPSLPEAIKDVNAMFEREAGLSDVSSFMERMAATESNLGQDKLGDWSYSAFQIDPIKYRDIVEKAQGGGEAARRVDIANRFLRERLNDPSFDILNVLQGESVEGQGEKYAPNEQLRAHSPLIGATLARLGLANIPDAIPQDLTGQAGYWKRFWNTLSGKGDIMDFIEKSNYHRLGE